MRDVLRGDLAQHRQSSGLTKRMLTTVASRRSPSDRAGVSMVPKASSASPLLPWRRSSRAAERQRGQFLLDRHARALRRADSAPPPAIAQRRGVEHLAAFVLVRGRHDHHVGDAAQERQIVAAVVGRAVAADQAGAIDARTRTGRFCSATSWISWS